MSYKKKEKDLPDFEDVSSEMNKPIEERIGYPDGNFISAKECMELVELRKKVLIKDAQIAGLIFGGGFMTAVVIFKVLLHVSL